MTEALAYLLLALDLVVGAAIIYGVLALVWWLAHKTARAVRKPDQEPPKPTAGDGAVG